MAEMIIIGLGPGGLEQLSYGAWRALKDNAGVYLRTAKHPVVEELKEMGIEIESFDYLYEKGNTFEEVYQEIVDILIDHTKKALPGEKILYAVPGHPFVAEESVRLLLHKCNAEGIKRRVIASMSFLESTYALLQLDPLEGVLVKDALCLNEENMSTAYHTIYTQVYNRLVASDLKLALLRTFPAEHGVSIINKAGIPGKEEVKELPLWEMDHYEIYDHLTSVWVKPLSNSTAERDSYSLAPLISVMERLLSPEGCPWDREQTHDSLKPYLIEEAYEVIEAIDRREMHKLKEELGDLLLQVVFHTMLAQERGAFSIEEVVDGITSKMVRRHPHVFGNISVANKEEVLVNWEQIKAEEKSDGQESSQRLRVMDSINKSLPALLMAEEVQKKAMKLGFDWDKIEGPWDKLQEEIDELGEAIKTNKGIEEELGDILFSVVNIARFVKISPETALYKTIQKFIFRFNYIENKLDEKGLDWKQMDLQSLDIIWDEAKKAGN